MTLVSGPSPPNSCFIDGGLGGYYNQENCNNAGGI